MPKVRKGFSAKSLIRLCRKTFAKFTQYNAKWGKFPIEDMLSAGLAIFGVKFSSLLQFDHCRKEIARESNLKSLYAIKDIPSDTYFRERVDEVDPKLLKIIFPQIFSRVQQSKILSQFNFYDNHYLVSMDGTQYFNSHTIHCENCDVKHHKDGRIDYYHQSMVITLVHPDSKIVLPMGIEEIAKTDGFTKNDCELNAGKRLLMVIKEQHPKLNLIVTTDSLLANGPIICLLQKLKFDYILKAKPGNHKLLFEWVEHSSLTCLEFTDSKGTYHRYSYINEVPLNETNFDINVNFIDYEEINNKGNKKHFSFITNLEITNDNIEILVKGGRAEWKIENETFNTLKNQGYEFEHNFGHGYKNLCSVMSVLMLLSFLIDQVYALANARFIEAVISSERKLYFWDRVKSYFDIFIFNEWEELWSAIRDREKVIGLNNIFYLNSS